MGRAAHRVDELEACCTAALLRREFRQSFIDETLGPHHVVSLCAQSVLVDLVDDLMRAHQARRPPACIQGGHQHAMREYEGGHQHAMREYEGGHQHAVTFREGASAAEVRRRPLRAWAEG